MDLSLTLRFRSPELCLFPRKSISPINFPGRQHEPIIPRHKTNPETGLSAPKLHLIVTAKKRSPIEGVSEELNAIASQNLDTAPARRRVRLAFVEVQQQLDHCLFKVGLVPSSSWFGLCDTLRLDCNIMSVSDYLVFFFLFLFGIFL